MRRLLLGLVGMSMLFIGTCVNDTMMKLLPVCRYGDSANWPGNPCEAGWIEGLGGYSVCNVEL